MTRLFGEGKILGREPTLWVAVIAAFLNLLVGFQLDYLSADQAAWINAVINAAAAIYVAWETRPIAPQVYTYAISSIAGLLASYGLDLSQEMVTSVQGFILVVLALSTRAQVSPAEDADKTGVLGDKVTTEDIPTA